MKKEAPSLRSFDKREAQRKSLKEEEEEEAAENYEIVSPKIYYEDNEVDIMQIWLDLTDFYGVIYIGPFVTSDGKKSSIRLRYTIDKSEQAKTSNASKDEIITDWEISDMDKIVVKHNKLNNGIIIEKIFGFKDLPGNKVKKSMYIPMSRILHILTNDSPYHTDVIEK